jgi:hypothetical protein
MKKRAAILLLIMFSAINLSAQLRKRITHDDKKTVTEAISAPVTKIKKRVNEDNTGKMES